ncbi:MAG: bacteriohemerythrin [Treponema sp.]|jgi:hemerythrin|nr:bacteriohemerythrin [Treponema sp.]
MEFLEVKKQEHAKTDKVEYIVWKQEYSVEVEEIDNQHKELLNIVNSLLSCYLGNKTKGKEFFIKIINGAFEHIKFHFATEENIMQETHYPNYAEHKAEHDNMVGNLTVLINDTVSGKIEFDVLAFALNLKDWFLNHIPEHDIKAKECFKNSCYAKTEINHTPK